MREGHVVAILQVKCSNNIVVSVRVKPVNSHCKKMYFS